MNKFIAIAATLATVTAFSPTAAHAEAPEGPRAEVIVGWDNMDGNSRLDTDGVMYGLGLGYDIPVASNLSIGIDAEISDSDVEKVNMLGTNVSATYSAERDLYAGGRITYAASDRLNLFATVGYTNQRIHGETSLGAIDNENLDGVRVGAGVQYDLGSNVYLTSSYRYSNYSNDLERHQIVGGIGIRF